MKTILKLAASAVILALPVAAHAATEKVTATMSNEVEVPKATSKGMGQFVGTYDPSSRKLTYTVNYENLTGPATAAHFHAPAPKGKDAGVEIPVKGSVESPIRGDLTLTPEQAKNLTDGMTYFNIHTEKNPKGELRGQLQVEK